MIDRSIVLVGGEKGGTGKSNLAMNLATWLAVNKQEVLLLDADPQGTSANWVAERNQYPELPTVHCVQRYGNLFHAVQDLRTRYAHIVIDAGGRDSEELRSAMGLADKLYSLAKASQSDLWTIKKLAKLVDLARCLNHRLEARVVISMAPTNPRIDEEIKAKKMMEEYAQNLPLSRVTLHERKPYRDATAMGRGVIEMPAAAKAAEEIDSIAREIYDNAEVQIESNNAARVA